MIDPVGIEDMGLLEYVRDLENKNNQTRCQQVQVILESFGIKPSIQESRLLRIKNIIVDFSSRSMGNILLFSAHYDAVKGSPGANDNASSVAVLLGLCRKLMNAPLPIRIVFFDREEAWLRTGFINLGLLGSLYYVWKNNLSNIAVVYNLEYCGQGGFLSVWPVKNREKDLPAIRMAERVAAGMRLGFRLAHIPWLLFSSDHLSFRFKGISNSVTLTLLPLYQLPLFERMIADLSIPRLLLGKRPVLPEPLVFVHSSKDTSLQLSERSLRLMLSVLINIINTFIFRTGVSQLSLFPRMP
jgi:aminopeptidase YwaD